MGRAAFLYGIHDALLIETDLNFDRAYCRFALVIVGKPAKLLHSGTSPYVNFIRTSLLPSGYDTIYLLSRAENSPFLQLVANELSPSLQIFDATTFKTTLYYPDNKQQTRKVSLLVLRRKDVKLYLEQPDSK